jgi:RNA polymerase sigma-70 factor (ECF subfamily)
MESFGKGRVMSFVHQSESNEEHLILEASRGNLDAFNLLVLKYQDLVYNHAYALLGDHYAAEDATQESFIKAFRNIDRFRGGPFRPWLLRIATNTCYDEFRKSKRRTQIALYAENEYGEELDNPAWIVDLAPSPQATFEQKELSHNLYRMIDELPAGYRSALTLVDIHDLDYAEAAQALGIPLGTLKSRLVRARLLMRKKLLNHYECSKNFAIGNISPLCA